MPIAKRLLWLALLLPQFALLLFFIYDDLRGLRHELQFGSPRMLSECISEPPFNPLTFGVEFLGLAATIGLCAWLPWARWGYSAFAVIVFVALAPDFRRAFADQDGVNEALHGSILLTLTLTFALSFRPSVMWRTARPSPGLPPHAAA